MKRVANTRVVYEFSKNNKPALTIEPGERVILDTLDCLGGQIKTERDTIDSVDFARVNPATGPIYVNTACPGDMLIVEIEEMELGEEGIMLAVPALGILGDQVAVATTKVVKVASGKVRFSEDVLLPINPMIGVIGVAPAGDAVSCGIPGDHGGNMDTRDISPGAKVYFPVFVEGALLAMGDVHAVMGNGEACGTGVEVSATITIKVDVLRGSIIKRPLVETKDSFMTIGSAEKLEEAVKIAARDMASIMSHSLKISFEEAYMLLSAAGDVKVSQIVNPLRTARVRVPKDIIPCFCLGTMSLETKYP